MCPDCRKVRDACGGKAPVGWRPFGPGVGDDTHYYVFSEATPDPEPGEVQPLDTIPLCEVPDPRPRP
jgi:hypothetical protein